MRLPRLLSVLIWGVLGVECLQSDWQPIPSPGQRISRTGLVFPESGAVAAEPRAASPAPSFLDVDSEESSRLLVGSQGSSDHCTLHKVIFHQDSYHQYMQYKTHIPDLKEFTLCTWHKFYNHSSDHPLFSYGHRDRPREIVSWVSNDARSSFYQLAVSGHTLYRLNYPVRLHRWYHSCQSWNSKTGEWQIWINSERVGRGFYNLAVGRVIKGGGTAVTGQDQRQLNGDFGSGYGYPGASFGGVLPSSLGGGIVGPIGGLSGEITLVNLYKAALTAGKAYTNHKHHHAHKFHHEDQVGEDDPENQGLQGGNVLGQDLFLGGPGALPPAPPPPPPEGATEFPFLRGMQIVPRLPIEELDVVRQQQQALQQQAQQALGGVGGPQPLGADLLSPSIFGPGTRLFKRDHSNSTKSTESKEHKVEKRDTMTKSTNKTEKADKMSDDKGHKKRTLDSLLPGVDLTHLYPGGGLPDDYNLGGGLQLQLLNTQDIPTGYTSADIGGPKPVEMEPAEWEVRSIMAVCTGCGSDPFRKANILSWRSTHKKLFGGALYLPAKQLCHEF